MIQGFALLKKNAALCGVFFLILLLPIFAIAAEPATAFSAEAGVSITRFHYAEFDDQARLLDTERGDLGGLNFRLAKSISALEIEASGSYQRGWVSYVGQTNLGVPHFTRTHETIGDLALRAGWWLNTPYAVMPYVGIGWRGWERDIAATPKVGGLYEYYQWKYAWLGAKMMAYQHETSHLIFDIGAIKPIQPMMDIDFKGNFNAPPSRVYPVSRTGWRALITARQMLTNKVSFTAEPFLEYWYLHRSPSVRAGNFSIHEPASETKNYGINLRLGMLW